MAPLVLELQKHPELESVVCITAQHREMLDSVMDCFGIRADYDLNIMQQGQDLTAITTRVLERMRDVLNDVRRRARRVLRQDPGRPCGGRSAHV